MEATMQSGRVGRLVNCGIPYVVKIRDNQLFFFDDGMLRCLVFIVYKNDPHGLVMVDVRRDGTPLCHLAKATAVAEHLIGPNHFRSLEEMHRFESRHALRNAVTLKTYGLGLRVGWRLRCLWYAIRHRWQLRHQRPPRIEWTNFTPGGGAAEK